MKKMLCVAVAAVCFSLTLRSQLPETRSIFIEDFTAKRLPNLKTEGVEGSPYLYEAWLPGKVTFENGKTANVASLKFSPFNNTLYFLQKDVTYEFVEPVKEFEMYKSEKGIEQKLLFRSGYPAIERQSPATFYMVMKDDSIQVLRLVQRTIEEFKGYNQPVQQKFVDRIFYYAFSDGKITRVKKR